MKNFKKKQNSGVEFRKTDLDLACYQKIQKQTILDEENKKQKIRSKLKFRFEEISKIKILMKM